MDRFNISVLVCSYNPNYEKMIETLNSIILQINIKFQIVVADDGSKEDYFDNIEKFFREKSFNDYKLVKNDKNQGTVLNVISGVMVCDGEYIKPISPGDFLHNENVLFDWYNYSKNKNYGLVGSNYVCYNYDKNNKFQVISNLANPQVIYKNTENLTRAYVLFDNIFLGAATLVKKELLVKYLDLMKNKVIYAEDNVYRIMAFCNEKVGFYNKETIFYEFGTGVSTSSNIEWKNKIRNDWENTNKIIQKLDTVNHKLKKDLELITKLNAENFSKIKRVISKN